MKLIGPKKKGRGSVGAVFGTRWDPGRKIFGDLRQFSRKEDAA